MVAVHLQDRPSLRYIRDVMRMRNADFIELCFESDAELVDALDASGMVCWSSCSAAGTATVPYSIALTLCIDVFFQLFSSGETGWVVRVSANSPPGKVTITHKHKLIHETFVPCCSAEGSISMTNSSSSSSTPSSSIDSISCLASMSDSGETVAERLQQQYERAQATANKQTALEQRQQRRKDYMEQAGQVWPGGGGLHS